MPLISINLDPYRREDLDSARDLLDSLIARLVPAVRSEGAGMVSAEGDAAAALVDDLWKRLGMNLRLLAIAAATFDSAFTLVDLSERLKRVATELGVELDQEPTLERVKGQWNGQLVPSAARAGESVRGAPPFKRDAYNDGHLWHFTVDPAVRDAIRDQDLAAPYFEEKSE